MLDSGERHLTVLVMVRWVRTVGSLVSAVIHGQVGYLNLLLSG